MKHLIQLWTGDWFKQMAKTNLAVGENNCLDNYGGKKWLVCSFRSHELWKYIGCIISTVNYGNKGHNIWGETQIYVDKKIQNKLHRDVCEKTDLLKVRCDLYRSCYCHAFQILFYLTQLQSYIGCYFDYLPLFSPYRSAVFL